MSMLLMVGALCGVGTFLFASWAMDAGPGRADLLDARLREFDGGAAEIDFNEVELAIPFAERVLKPVLGRVSRGLAGQQPAEKLRALQVKLNQAEHPWGLDAGGFLLMQLIAFPVGAILGLVLNRAVLNMGGALAVAIPAAGGALCYFLPKFKVRTNIRKRTKEIDLALPDAIDLLTIAVEAGSTFDAALTRVTEKYTNALAREFKRTLNEIRLGRARVEAIEELGNRCGVEGLKNLCSAIIQAEQLGVGTAQVLRIQSQEIRRRRRQKAEELGAKAPLKMLFPMVGCIFPCLFIVLLGPAVLNVALGVH